MKAEQKHGDDIRTQLYFPSLLSVLALFFTSCTLFSFQDRARTPLKEMKSVVHVKSKSFDVPPKVLEGFRPEYPELEADRREKGFVSIICTVGTDGRATDFAVESMTNPAFAYEAMRAIAKWHWAPAMKDGRPVAQQIRVPMHFNAI
ncbi:MAG: energy transducer TonB [Chthoniobacterales bacterium]